jgi:hypothetical protein
LERWKGNSSTKEKYVIYPYVDRRIRGGLKDFNSNQNGQE